MFRSTPAMEGTVETPSPVPTSPTSLPCGLRIGLLSKHFNLILLTILNIIHRKVLTKHELLDTVSLETHLPKELQKILPIPLPDSSPRTGALSTITW